LCFIEETREYLRLRPGCPVTGRWWILVLGSRWGLDWIRI
jgi:hypothetical protein